MGQHHDALIERVEVAVLRVPTEEPESDGTLVWDATTMVVVEVSAGGVVGLGWTYGAAAAAAVVRDVLADAVRGRDAMAVGGAAVAMGQAVRNLGRTGVCAHAIAAVDVALWDLKARLLGVSLAGLLGPVRDRVPLYGSGGFTSLSTEALVRQMRGWVERGFLRVKMKVGREPERDPARVRAVREAVGDRVELMVDANGALSRKQALAAAEAFGRAGVVWFEEPVTSDDLAGLRLLRDRAPAGMAIAAGEYGYEVGHFRGLLEAGAVDVLQADLTRCMGVTGFLVADGLCQAHRVPLSAHCAPALHAHVAAAAPALCHVESFHDHERIEGMLVDGAPQEVDGVLVIDHRRPGHGMALRWAEARRFRL